MLLLESFARDGLTDDEIAREKLHVSVSTFYDWSKRFDEFSKAIKKGRTPVNIKVEKTFFETKLQPQTITETITEKTINRDKDGNITGTSEHIRKSERYIPADTTAILFYLKCRLPGKYNDKLNVKVDSNIVKELPKLYEALKENNNNDVRETVTKTETDI